ncbi:MAG TPA: hypothetical protein VHL11_24870 [Phototrophicaceae bacterium]|jgi:hypothetical protein|nr:hypothetical protein [Phototrophicaceae bacterium]
MIKRFKIAFIVFITGIVLWFAFNILEIWKLIPRATLSSEMLEAYWQNPPPPPDALIDIVTQAKNGENFCIYINPAALWTSGDEADDIYFTVQGSFELYIDAFYRPTPSIVEMATMMQMGDEGSFGGPMSTCIELANLSYGLHWAEVEFLDTHGQLYSYIWAFKVS